MTLRQPLMPLALVVGMTLAATGCQSCSHSMDYLPPVADCQCGTCGTGRTGSVGGYGGYSGYSDSGSYVEAPSAGTSGHCESCNQ